MKKVLFISILLALGTSCSHKKVSLAGDPTKVDLADFIGSFQSAPLPFQFSDSLFDQDASDSSLISYSVFTKFIADTVLTKHFSKGVKPKVFPIGKVRNSNKETYLFARAIHGARQLAYVIGLDPDNKFMTAKPLLENDGWGHATVSLDKGYTLTVLRQWKSTSGEMLYKKNAYLLNAGAFMLILTESNEKPAKARAVLNPIDTLPRKHKFSGDYVQDKINFISVRDGRDASHIRFFVHFEKDNGSCKGELKGQAKMISPTVARYTSDSDPCKLDFDFSSGKVSMKELEGCGNFRDIKCFFEGIYFKQKEPKKRSSVKHH